MSRVGSNLQANMRETRLREGTAGAAAPCPAGTAGASKADQTKGTEIDVPRQPEQAYTKCVAAFPLNPDVGEEKEDPRPAIQVAQVLW